MQSGNYEILKGARIGKDYGPELLSCLESTQMKSLVVYVSVEHGNTEKVAKAISEVLGADLKKVEEVDLSTIQRYDLIGFGSGIYSGKLHVRLLKLVDGMPLSRSKAFFFHWWLW